MAKITLCMIVHGQVDRVEKAIESVGKVCDQIAIVDQGSKEEDANRLCKLADLYFYRLRKGYADPDRAFLYEIVPSEWILALDADEELSLPLQERIPDLITLSCDVFWFRFENKVDGIDIRDLLGDDYHPRLWRKGALSWPDRAHTYPQIHSQRQYFCSYPILHHRTYEEIVQSHRKRRSAIDENAVQIEEKFLEQLRRKLGK